MNVSINTAGGFINILKPPGMSSHDVISYVRKVLGIKKVGHAGTLDPAAAGVLPVALGKATRFIEYLELADKKYRAEISFGIATDSGDDTGSILATKDNFVLPNSSELNQCLAKFKGTITQIPPAHSAIKINGRRACDLLRAGEKVDIPQRKITIHNLELLKRTDKKILIDVECSKGTYIRSLCIDIGEALNIPAHMSFLVRTGVGKLLIENAVTLEMLKEMKSAVLIPADEILDNLAQYNLNPQREKAFRNGLSTSERTLVPATKLLRIYSADKFIGIGRYDSNKKEIIPVKVLGN